MNEYSSDTKKVAEKLAGMTEACANVHDDEPYATWESVPDDLKWLAENCKECPCAYIKKTIGGYESADMRNQFSSLGRYFTRDQWQRARYLYEAKEYCLKWDETDAKQAKQDSQQDEVSEPDYDMSIHSNPDAVAWAEFFIKTFPNGCSDMDTMVCWFANAMMAMHDHVLSEKPKEQSQEWDGDVNLLVEMIIKCEDMTAAWLESLAEAKRKSAEEKRRDEVISELAREIKASHKDLNKIALANDYQVIARTAYDWLVSTNRLTEQEE